MILAIDPGPNQSACLVWDGQKIRSYNIIPNEAVISLLQMSTPWTKAAVEHMQCFGMPVGQTVFETAYWIGEFRATCKRVKREFLPVYRLEVKMHHCKSARAKDSNITQTLIDRFGGKGTKANPGITYGLKKDLWSAFAIAVMVQDKASLGGTNGSTN